MQGNKLFFSISTEAKGQRRVFLPAHLVWFRKPPSPLVLFCELGASAQTGGSWAGSFSPGATRAVLSPVGEVSGSPGEETEKERGGEPLWSITVAVTSLASCQRSQGCRSQAARTGPDWRCVQRDHHLLWRPPAGLTGQRACQSHQNEYCRPGKTRLTRWTWDRKVKSQEGLQVFLLVLKTHFVLRSCTRTLIDRSFSESRRRDWH